MNTLRVGGALFDLVAGDLRRPHPFAAERVGFLLTRLTSTATGDVLLARRWHSVPDEGYLDDPDVGARISRDTIREVLRRCLEDQLGALHVHCHDHPGPPGPSYPDEQTFHQLTPAFMGAASNERHGAVIFSSDEAHGRLLAADGPEPLRIVIVGRPLRLWSTS